MAWQSLQVDSKWIRSVGIPWSIKTAFLVQKYLFIILSPLYWSTRSQAYAVSIAKRTFYFPSIRHIAFIQGIFMDHSYLARLIPPSSIVVDVGAHIGEFALVCDTILHTKHILCIEPVNASYRLLKKNIPHVNAYNVAIGTGRYHDIHVPPDTVQASGIPQSNSGVLEQPTWKSMDDIREIQQLEYIDLLKIDTEGTEWDVIQSSQKTVQRSRYIIVEMSINRDSTIPAIEMLEGLQRIVPSIQPIHVGNIFTDYNTKKQLAADILFYNPDATSQ